MAGSAMSPPLRDSEVRAMEDRRSPSPNPILPLTGGHGPGRALPSQGGAAVPESTPGLLDEHSPGGFRFHFGSLLARSLALDTAILKVRLGAVDLSSQEISGLRRIRLLVAELSARTLEEEAYALIVDPEKRENLERILDLLRQGRLEIRSAPLGGWSPDFSVFVGDEGPHSLLIGLHWFQKPFPHRGPAWAARFGSGEARRAERRFSGIWGEAHDIGPAIQRLLERAAHRGREVQGVG